MADAPPTAGAAGEQPHGVVGGGGRPHEAPGGAGPFERDTAVRPTRADGPRAGFTAVVSPHWRAGRGPHGGYLAAMLLRALTLAVADERRAPRSLTIHYARAPQPGPVLISTMLERGGRSLSTLSARMEQDGSLIAIALAAFSVPWEGPEISELPMPDVQPPEAPREAGTARRWGGPPFTENIVLQPRLGGLPFSGEQAAMELGAWIGLAEARALDAPALAFFSDALIPAPFMRMQQPSPAPTVDLTVHFRAALAPPAQRDAYELVFARVQAGLVHEGFFTEDTVIWSADGSVLSQSRQLAILMAGPIG